MGATVERVAEVAVAGRYGRYRGVVAPRCHETHYKHHATPEGHGRYKYETPHPQHGHITDIMCVQRYVTARNDTRRPGPGVPLRAVVAAF